MGSLISAGMVVRRGTSETYGPQMTAGPWRLTCKKRPYNILTAIIEHQWLAANPWSLRTKGRSLPAAVRGRTTSSKARSQHDHAALPVVKGK